MTITCPKCGFFRNIDPAAIPPGVELATCPRCREKFDYRQPQPPAFTDATEISVAPAPAASFASRDEDFIPPPPAPALETLPKAGFWLRVVAALIDSAIVSVLQFVFTLLLGVATGVDETLLNQPGEIMLAIVTGLFGVVLAIFYYVFFTGYSGQTPGKMALRIKVIRTDGADIGYGRAFLREVPAKFISGIILGIGYLMVAFDQQKQGLHDRIADTYVIKI